MTEVKQCTFINHKHAPHTWFDPILDSLTQGVIGKNTYHCEGTS